MEDNKYINYVEEFAISNMFPLLGDALSARASIKNEETHRFIQDVLVDVNTRLWRLEQRLDKEYMKSEDFVNFLHKTFIKVALDLRKEKIKLFSNIIVNSTLIGKANENDNRKYLFDETIDKIDEKLFEFLLRMSPRVLDGLDLEAEGWKGEDDELKILGVDRSSFHFNAEYLLSVGVVIRLPRFNMDVESGTLEYHDEYFVTQYGLEFVEYVKDQEPIEEAVAEEV